MELTTIMEMAASAITAVGGWEAVRYMLNRKTNRRKEEAEATTLSLACCVTPCCSCRRN